MVQFIGGILQKPNPSSLDQLTLPRFLLQKGRLVLISLFLLLSFRSHSQWTLVDNYSSNSNWTTVDLDNSGSQVIPPRIFIDQANGVCQFNNSVNGPNESYVSRKLDTLLCDDWTVEVDFIIQNINPNSTRPIEEVAHFIVAMSSDHNKHPWRDFNKNPTGSDFVGLLLTNPSAGNYVLTPFISQNSVKLTLPSGCRIPLQKNQPYTARLERIDETNGKFTLLSGSGTWIGDCCFTIPANLKDLEALQHANNPNASYRRNLTAAIFETRLLNCGNVLGCHFVDEIQGPDSICDPVSLPATFSGGIGTNTAYKWNLPVEVSKSTAMGGSVTIEELTSPSDTLTLELVQDCDCFSRTIRKKVYVTQCDTTTDPIEPEEPEVPDEPDTTECEVRVPNVFTPDGNGINDRFGVFGCPFESFELTIYNRWGNILFRSTDPEKLWDGRYLGNPSPEGAYILFVKGRKVDGKSFRKHLVFTLLR